MKPIGKASENSVTNSIIRKVHLTLADTDTGTEILNFLRSTEPVFMDEVNRFIRTEVSRLNYTLSESQALYVGSIIGAAYISGFLIAREATHSMFNGLFSFTSDLSNVLTQQQIDSIMDDNRNQGKSYKEIAKLIESMLKGSTIVSKSKNKDEKPKKNKGNRFNIGHLE